MNSTCKDLFVRMKSSAKSWPWPKQRKTTKPYWVSENSSAFSWGRTCWWRLWTVRCRSHYAKCLRVKRRLLPRFLDAENGLNCEWSLNSTFDIFDLILWCANSDSQNLLVDKNAGNSLRVICQDLWGLIKVEFIILMSHAKVAKVSSVFMLNVAKHYSSLFQFRYTSITTLWSQLFSLVTEALKAGTDDEDHRGSSGSPGRGNKKSLNLQECKTKLTEHFQYAMWCCQIH